ncbi:MAG: hypothetical protein H3C58_13950, partial [Fimbriimonadaceae bacterium]|nr:hypothetical protein [Fimbriimonadaceae bacterium]
MRVACRATRPTPKEKTLIDNLSELLTLLATFVGSAVALARYSLNQHRA